MSRFAELFARMRAERRAALMPFLEAGAPSLADVERMIPALVDAGADAIELGVPFSDPIADGPTMQLAAFRALEQGVTLGDVLALVRRVRERVTVPIALLSYYNPLLRYGLAAFARDASAAGVDGVITADLPADEGEPLVTAARPHSLDTIFLVAPTSTEDRLRTASAAATGFLYCVSLTGVTGARAQLSSEVIALLRNVRRVSDLPAVVGFGISTPDHARAVAREADGVIVASALYRAIEQATDPAAAAAVFIRPFADAVRR
jgi:tryptophan synthase alpha chain